MISEKKELANEIFRKCTKENAATDTEYVIVETDSRIIITFECSRSIIDWIYNFNFCRSKEIFCDINVHRGFLKKWLSVSDDIIKAVSKTDKNISLRGFSQGGAMALLCHLFLKKENEDLKIDTIVCGCPPVFAKEDSFKVSTTLGYVILVEYGYDFIPSLVTNIYEHVGQEIHLGPVKTLPPVDILLSIALNHHSSKTYYDAISTLNIDTTKRPKDSMWEEIKDWISYTYEYKIMNIYYNLRSRIRQSHVIETDLKKGQYWDKDSLIVNGLMWIVSDFVSKDGEDAFGFVEWEHDDHHSQAKQDIIKVLHWYHVGRPQMEKDMDEALSVGYAGVGLYNMFEIIEGTSNSLMTGSREITKEKEEARKKYAKLEETLYDTDTEILKLIIDIRGYLWT